MSDLDDLEADYAIEPGYAEGAHPSRVRSGIRLGKLRAGRASEASTKKAAVWRSVKGASTRRNRKITLAG